MLHLDAAELYELPEAARLLLADPGRLAREARRGRIPATLVGDQLGLPAPWVRAAAGIDPVDEEGLRTYWLARLAPPPRTSHRPSRPRAQLPAEDLLTPDQASRRLLADDLRLARWDGEGTLPALRVEGETRYDSALVELIATGANAEARRALVRQWARFEWTSRASPTPPAPAAPKTPADLSPAPTAFTLPEDLRSEESHESDAPPGRLIRTEGFETVDED